MNILVIGGAGFIGFNISKFYADKGHTVDIVDDLSRGKIDKEFKRLLSLNNVNLINATLFNVYKNMKDNYDLMFHLAAIVGVKNVNNKPYDTLNDNIFLTDLALQIAKNQRYLKRFVFTSTSEVYSSAVEVFSAKIPTKEKTPLIINDIFEPRSTYKLSKIVGEVMCVNSGVPYTILRPHNIYGPRMGMDHVIPELIKKMIEIKDSDIIKIKSYEHTRAFCYIDDAINIIALIVDSSFTKNKVLNLGCEKPEISIGALAELINKVINKKIIFQPGKIENGSPSRRSPDMAYTLSLIDSYDYFSLEEGLKKTFNWYSKFISKGCF